MKSIITILCCIFCFGLTQSNGQVISALDSIKLKADEKRQADSTRIALQKKEIENKQDSMAAAIKKNQEERLERQDSIRVARQKQRALELENKREFLSRKKERAHIRDSIKQESERAAAARKAYLKSQKKKEKSAVNKKDAKPAKIVEKKEKVVKERKEKKQKVQKAKKEKAPNEEIEKEIKDKKLTKKKADKPKTDEKEQPKKKEQTEKATDLKNKDKPSNDSLVETVQKKEPSSIQKNNDERILVTKDIFIGTNTIQAEIFREPPAKKTTYFSFQFGSSNYLGDLGGNSRLENNILGDINLKENTYFYGFSFSHLRREVIGLRFSYIFGSIAGSDKNTYFQSANDPSYARYLRNLDFKSKISEGSLMLELHPFKIFSYKKKLHNSYLQPYLLMGIGNYTFNPQGSYYDEILDENVWVDLQPLALEGQGMAEYPDRQPYKLSQWNIPFGVGFNYEISPTIQLGLEYVGRKLFTDYLDDVSTSFIDPSLFELYLTPENAEIAQNINNKSRLIDAGKAYTQGDQRGNASSNDMYFSVSARMIIKLNKNRNKGGIKKKRRSSLYKYDDYEICE